MNFSQRQADPRKHLVGITFVILLHVLIVYALVTGLAKKVVDVVNAPIEVKVLEEVRKPPPPPEVIVPPPPKFETPPSPFIPPPEVQIAAPPPPVPTITAVTPTPPRPHVVVAPPAPPAPPPPKPQSAEPVAAGVACSKMPPPVPPAVTFDVHGSFFVLATIKAGRVVEVVFERDTMRGVSYRAKGAFRQAIETAMKGYVCAGDAVQIRQEFAFDIK